MRFWNLAHLCCSLIAKSDRDAFIPPNIYYSGLLAQTLQRDALQSELNNSVSIAQERWLMYKSKIISMY